MRWFALLVTALVLLAVASADGEVWEEDEHEVLIRSERATKNRDPCKYSKGTWSECDPSTNMRSRTLTLKKGDQTMCEKSKTIQKKCKKGKHDKKRRVSASPSSSTSLPAACRYEKGGWSECNGQGEMRRDDKLKPNSDPTCEQSRQITKKCRTKKGAKPPKTTKGGRRNRQ